MSGASRGAGRTTDSEALAPAVPYESLGQLFLRFLRFGALAWGGPVVQIEAAPGIVIVVPAWMLDRAACAGMSIGAPRIAVAALVELHRVDGSHCSRRPIRRSAGAPSGHPAKDWCEHSRA